MAAGKKASKKATKNGAKGATTAKAPIETEAKFPYTTKPNSLRKLLKLLPTKPKPPKVDQTQLRSWGFNDANDYSMIRVLKALDILDSKNQPTNTYADYMQPGRGPKALAPAIKRVYAPLFNAAHAPYNEDNSSIAQLFNIHSGGSERTLEQQIQTFKALCESADFSEAGQRDGVGPDVAKRKDQAEGKNTAQDSGSGPIVHINLHIHLPEGKGRRDYEYIIEDIGRHIFGRKGGSEDAS